MILSLKLFKEKQTELHAIIIDIAGAFGPAASPLISFFLFSSDKVITDDGVKKSRDQNID